MAGSKKKTNGAKRSARTGRFVKKTSSKPRRSGARRKRGGR